MAGQRGLRPRRSVDYTAASAPGTPVWLKLSHSADVDPDDSAVLEKENAQPALADSKVKRSALERDRTADVEEEARKKGLGRAGHKDTDEGAAEPEQQTNVGGATGKEKHRKKAKHAAASQAPAEPAHDGRQHAMPTSELSDEPAPKKPVRKSEPAKGHKKPLAAGPQKRKSAPDAVSTEGSQPDDVAGSQGGKRKKAKSTAAPIDLHGADAKPAGMPISAQQGEHAQPADSQETWSTTGTAKSGSKATSAAGGKADSKVKGKAPRQSKGKKVAAPAGAAVQPPALAQEAGASQPAMNPAPAPAVAPVARPVAPSAPLLAPAAPAPAAPAVTVPAAAAPPAPEARPAPAKAAVLPPLGPAAEASSAANFKKLQVEYAVLQEKYQAVKRQRIEGVEKLMNEQAQKAMEHREAALRLVEHWKREAERQAQFAQAAGSERVREEHAKLRADNAALRQQVMEVEAALLEQQEQAAELRAELAAAWRRAQSPLKACMGVQVSPLPQRAQQAGEPPFAGSCLSQPLQQALSPSAVESQAAAHTPACRPLQEARAMCPEGADISEASRHQPVPGPAAAGAHPWPQDSPAGSGRVECCPSARPLVPYSIGCSAVQPRSRFAAEAADAPPGAAAAEPPPLQAAAAAKVVADNGSRGAVVSAPAILTRHAWPAAHSRAPGQDEHAGEKPEIPDGNGSAADEQGNGNSGMTQKALNTLVGLEAAPSQHGGFLYTHRGTGFVFEICPFAGDSEPMEEGDDDAAVNSEELAFNPVSMGHASEVLPEYLREEIVFSAAQKQKLVGRIMEALGTYTLRAARAAQQQAGA